MQKNTKYNHESFIGKRFSKLVLLSIDNKKTSIKCTCICDCGETYIACFYRLIKGKARECYKCLCKTRSHRATKHKMSGSRLERIWSGMISRCYTKTAMSYKNYGAKGISVCDEWRNSSSVFIQWALDNGYNDSLSIDRINPLGHYSPYNCRWVTQKDQCNNKLNNRVIEFNGTRMTAAQWADLFGVKHSLILNRIDKLGWSVERTLTTHPRKINRTHV